MEAELDYLEAELEKFEEDSGYVPPAYVRELVHRSYHQDLLGELYDCYHLNNEVRELMDSHAKSSFGIFSPYSFISDRDGTINVLRAFARQDEDNADRFAALDMALGVTCR